jgi:hypothetical protein
VLVVPSSNSFGASPRHPLPGLGGLKGGKKGPEEVDKVPPSSLFFFIFALLLPSFHQLLLPLLLAERKTSDSSSATLVRTC